MSRNRPEHLAPLFARAASGKSRAAAIKAFCIECVGFKRADVTNCTAQQCPLYPYRPYQRDDEQDAEVPA